ncbi:MAG: hypothetical protein H7066_20745 [Cytophagaceae bacterium]|nr:hypothetical protein [Gemmatimonadaceae bacterium]
MIRFLDAFGFAWHVTELPSNGVADLPGNLYFFSRGNTLRLRDYPAHWDDLSWRELESLRVRADVLSSDVTRPRPALWRATHLEAMA